MSDRAEFEFDQIIPDLIRTKPQKWVQCVWCKAEIAWEEIYCPYCGHEPFPPAQECQCKICRKVRKLWRESQKHTRARGLAQLKHLWPQRRKDENHKPRVNSWR